MAANNALDSGVTSYNQDDVRWLLRGALELIAENSKVEIPFEQKVDELNTLLSRDDLSDDDWLRGFDLLIDLDESNHRQGVCLADGACYAPALEGVESDMCAPHAFFEFDSPESEETSESDDDPEELAAEYKVLLYRHYAGEIKALSDYERLVELLGAVPAKESTDVCMTTTCERTAIVNAPTCEPHNVWSISVAWRKLTRTMEANQAAWKNGKAA